ncbi:MAG: dTMP kinase [Candidatus Saccharimonadales bacterium]
MFVTIDGPSGIGKSTLTQLVSNELERRSLSVIATVTPSKTAIGNLARSGTFDFSAHALSCLVAADRYYHDKHVVRPALARGITVVCDRYVPSSLVLDALDGVDRVLSWNLYQPISSPDLSFILVGDPAICLERATTRGQYSRFHAQDLAKASTEMGMFREVADWMQAYTPHPVQLFDIGSKTAEQVANDLTKIILVPKEDGR